MLAYQAVDAAVVIALSDRMERVSRRFQPDGRVGPLEVLEVGGRGETRHVLLVDLHFDGGAAQLSAHPLVGAQVQLGVGAARVAEHACVGINWKQISVAQLLTRSLAYHVVDAPVVVAL